MNSSTGSSEEKLPELLPEPTLPKLKATLIVRLHCGCTMSESVNEQRTKTSLQLWRAPTCERSSHFTGAESGWPQLVDATKATILHCDALSGK